MNKITCPKCNKECASEHGLSIHNYRVHTHKGRKVAKANMKAATKKRWSNKTQDNLNNLVDSHSAPKSLAFCPCCGTDLRKVAVAMMM